MNLQPGQRITAPFLPASAKNEPFELYRRYAQPQDFCYPAYSQYQGSHL